MSMIARVVQPSKESVLQLTTSEPKQQKKKIDILQPVAQNISPDSDQNMLDQILSNKVKPAPLL